MRLYNYKHELLAYLDDVNPSLEKILGGISTLSFVFYKDKYDNENGEMKEDERYKYVVNEAIVEYDGEFFIIKNSTPIHDEYGVVYKEVSCKYMSVELSGTKIDGLWGFSPTVESFESPYNRPTTIYNAFSDLLKNHTNGWELGIIPESEKRRTFEFEWVTPMQIIADLSQVYGYTPHFRTEYKYGKICKYVDLLTDDYGEVKGYYRHESTLKSMRKPITSDGITTRLYVFGYNDITLNDIPTESRTVNGVTYNIHEKGKSYIDNFDYYLKQGYTYEECLKYFIKTDVVRDDLYVDAEDLYTFGKEHIEKVSMPNVSYTVVITDIDFIGKPEIEIGHKIRIYDDEMNVDLIGRVSKVSFSDDDKENKLIEISNYYTLLEEVDLLTDMLIKQNTLQTRTIKRYSKFAKSIVINDSTGIIVQSDRQDLINPDSRMADDHIPYYRDVVRIGEYEYGKYGIQILDGELQMDRFDNKTRVLINNDEGFVMFRDKDGNGTFTDDERVFWVDYDGIAHANGFVITNSDIFVGEGETMMDRFETITQTVDGVVETTTNLSTTVNQNAEQISLKANKTEVSELKGTVDSHEKRIQEAEFKVTADAIISTVSETVENAKTEAINSSSQYVDGQLVNYYTKTESDSKIEQTASSVAVEVSKTEINNMQIGGVNLLIDSKLPLLLVSDDSNNDCAIVENDTVKLTAKSEGNVYGNLTNSESFEQNVEYTLSFEILTQHSLGMYWYPSEQYIKADYIQGSDSWQKVSFTYTQTGETRKGNALFGFYQLRANEVYYYKNLKLEKGNKATDFSPSFAEINNSIAKMEITANQIATTVAKEEVSKADFGGVGNLLLGTDNFEPSDVWHKSSITWHSDTFKGSKVYYVTTDWGGFKYKLNNLKTRHVLKANQSYTMSCYVIASASGIKGGIYTDGLGYLNNIDIPTSWTQVSYTFTPTQAHIDSITTTGTIRFEPYQLSGTGHKVYVSCYKLEKGGRATDYVRAEEDVPTTTQMNSAIVQKANEITSTVEETKRVGVELLPQSYLVNSLSGYYLKQGVFGVNESGIHSITTDRSWIYSDLIAIDRNKPIHCTYQWHTQGTGLTYIGFEQFDVNKNEIGSNASTIYWKSAEVTNNTVRGEFTHNANTFNEATRYVRLRILVNWNANASHTYTQFLHISAKQLTPINTSTQIAQMADKITSTVNSINTVDGKVNNAQSQINQQATQIATKVDVNGVKSTIQQNPESVRIGFNAISNYFDLNSARLRVGHSNGSYTEIGQNGVRYLDSYAGWSYHSLMKQGWLGDISGTSWSRTVTLPSSFKGKTFSVIVSVEMVNAQNTHDVIKHYKVTVPQATVDYANGKFVLNMSALAYYVPGQASASAITTNVSWIAIC